MTPRAAGPDPDGDLIRRFRDDPDGQDGRRAVEELFGRYDERVYAWCYRFCRDHERALDLAQEAQLEAFRALASFEGRSRFSSWLFAITRHRFLRTFRRPRLLVDDETEPDDVPNPAPDPLEELAKRDSEDQTLALVQQVLDPGERTALWLRCFEGAPVDVITKALGLETATGARGLLQTARRKLRAALEERQRQEASETR